MENEVLIRVGSFATVFFVVALAEAFFPKRSDAPRIRWWSNVSLFVLGIFVIRILFPIVAISVAALAADKQIGLFHQLALPWTLKLILGWLVLDLAIYLQHRAFHAIPFFWRFHRVHHADTGFDVTTGVRFHPIEIAFSMLIKFGVILAFGVPLIAVLIFEVLLNASSLFNHGNFRLPSTFERVLRYLIVTPDMHRIHHSSDPEETNTNFSFTVSFWDRLFRTYRGDANYPQTEFEIGLKEFRSPADQKTNALILNPFYSSKN